MSFSDLSANQLRVLTDARQTWDAYREAKHVLSRYAGGMTWKTVGGREYLVKVLNRRGANRSLGPRSAQTESVFQEWSAGKMRAAERETSLARSLDEMAGMSVGVRINRVPSVVTAALRRLDEFGLLGKNLMVIGTNALYAYEAAAGVQFDAGLLATSDVDLLWDARSSLKLALFDGEVAEAGLLAILKKVDRSFTPRENATFSAVNKAGFMVDLIKQVPKPPWKRGEPEKMAAGDLTPSWIENVKWLLASEKFHAVVVGQDGFPAPMICPEPRAFATYKQWLSGQDDRDPAKKARDQHQALAVAGLVAEKFPHLKFDAAANRQFPQALRELRRPP